MSMLQQLQNKYHKPGKWSLFLFCSYILLWIFFMTKKMDLLFFPYNDMFSKSIATEKKQLAFALKHNGKLISITKFGYWKKDMLEQSTIHFANYLKDDKQQYIDHFFSARMENVELYRKIYPYLKTSDVDFRNWAIWYLGQTRTVFQKNDQLDLIEYRWKNEMDHFAFIDSFTVKSVVL